MFALSLYNLNTAKLISHLGEGVFWEGGRQGQEIGGEKTPLYENLGSNSDSLQRSQS